MRCFASPGYSRPSSIGYLLRWWQAVQPAYLACREAGFCLPPPCLMLHRLCEKRRSAAATKPRVQHVAERVAEHIEAEDGEADRQPRPDCQCGVGEEIGL